MNKTNISFTTKFFKKNIDATQYEDFVLGADVGGTTTNVAIAGLCHNKIDVLFSLDFKTKEISSFLPALKKTLFFARNKYDIQVCRGCIGAAGIVSSDHSYVELTNASWNVDTNHLIRETEIDSLFILNDFQVLGYSINTVDVKNEKDVFIIRNLAISNAKKPRVLIGAGTGLGKTVLRYDSRNKLFHAFESEGGHTDIPIYNDNELELVTFIRDKKHPDHPVTYEDLLSGYGLTEIYTFLRSKKVYEETKFTRKIDQADDKPILISKFRTDDSYCKETFRLFTRFFARCAKNLALDVLSAGGVFIAGGIAGKNKEIFRSDEFIDEFNRSYMRFDFLKKIPIYLLSNYYLSLKGACFAASQMSVILNNQEMIKQHGDNKA